MWWYFLWENLNKHKFIFFNSKKKEIKNERDIINWFGLISKKVINLNYEDQKQYLYNVFGNQISYNFKDLIFDFEQLINLSKNELIEIGSHTLTHAKLTTLNNSEIYNELKNSNDNREKIGKK